MKLQSVLMCQKLFSQAMTLARKWRSTDINWDNCKNDGQGIKWNSNKKFYSQVIKVTKVEWKFIVILLQ